jgi:excisionase family DNA binding protein
MKEERIAYRPSEVPLVLPLSRSKVYEMIASGELPSVKVGGCLMVPAWALRRMFGETPRDSDGAQAAA